MEQKMEINLTDDGSTITEFSNIQNNVCFGSWDEIEQFEKEQNILFELRKPLIKPHKFSEINNVNLPKKEEPWKNQKEIPVVKLPKHTSLPEKKLPWAK
jgi:hypothetical protein